jgi:GNAT superfamily N-acetyltransferase
MMTLRRALASDIPLLVDLAREMHAESNFAPMNFDGEVFAATLNRLIEADQFALVAEIDGEIVGAMIGMLSQSWFGKDWMATDMGLFVRRDSRGGMTAPRLIRSFVCWAQAAGARQVRPGVSTGATNAERLYEGMGFTRAGELFVMNLEG